VVDGLMTRKVRMGCMTVAVVVGYYDRIANRIVEGLG
jgi:hypothetical protein